MKTQNILESGVFCEDSFKLIASQVKGKKVLLCGAVEEPPNFSRSILKKLLDGGAGEVFGVDKKPSPYPGVQSIVGDVETCDLGGPYDVILTGKVFNHLGNPQKFLERAKTFLSKNGQLIIKTPNAGSLQLIALKFTRRMRRSDYSNPEHVLWHDPASLGGLLERCGFTLVQLSFIQSFETWKQKALKPIIRVRPELSEDFMMIAERRST